MKRLKAMLCMLGASVLCLCIGIFAACGDKKDDDTTYYTVSATFDDKQGTVTISDPANAKGYIKDESVTITVTANTDFVIDEVTVNAAPVQLDAQGKYTFRVAGNTTIAATFHYDVWEGATYTEETLGTLIITKDGMTLEGEPVVIDADFTHGLPDGEYSVTIGGEPYKVSFGTYITFTKGYAEYVFDSMPSTDFSAYAGTWMQYGSDQQFVITDTSAAYLNMTFDAYYTAVDGSHYVKYRRGIGKPMRYAFDFLDEAEKVIYFIMAGNYYLFTEDGNLPEIAFPAEFYGKWYNETMYTLAISADGGVIREYEVEPFAYKNGILHVMYHEIHYTIEISTDSETGEKTLLMTSNSITYKFTPVKPELLPTEYRADWTQLGGTDTISVDSTGKFSYNGKAYDTTRDERDMGFHFTNDTGKNTNIQVSSDSFVLWANDGTTVKYFTKNGVTLPDLAIAAETGLRDTTWQNTEGDTLAIDADGKATIKGEKVQILTSERDEGAYLFTAIYDNAWYSFDNKEGKITFQSVEGDIVFTAGGGSATDEPTITIGADDQAFIGTWNEFGTHSSNHKLVISEKGNIKFDNTDVTESANIAEHTLTFTGGGIPYTATFLPEIGTADEKLAICLKPGSGGAIYLTNASAESKVIANEAFHNTQWVSDKGGATFAIDGDGKVTFNGEAVFVLSYGIEGGQTKWTMLVGGIGFYKAVATESAISLYSQENFDESSPAEFTFTAKAAAYGAISSTPGTKFKFSI